MTLLYKDDWEETKQRYAAWWAGENEGRCGLWVTGSRAEPFDVPPPPSPPETPLGRWTDLDYHAARNEHFHAHTFYGGEAFPTWATGYPGHKTMAVFLGCSIELDFNTGWVEPILTGPEIDHRSVQLDESNAWLQRALREQATAIRESKGKCIPCICGALGSSGDTLASLRGSERLLYDITDRPGQVREADLCLMDTWIATFDRFCTMVYEACGGTTCWYPLWAPGKFYAPQNDFAYMISPRHFRDLFLPSIRKQIDYLDYSIYHVDGEGNFNHLDLPLELPKLQAIQILPGSGKPSPLHYMPLLKKVQAAGKNLHIGISPDEVRPALSELSAKGLFIQTWCDTEAEARELLRNAEKWSSDRNRR